MPKRKYEARSQGTKSQKIASIIIGAFILIAAVLIAIYSPPLKLDFAKNNQIIATNAPAKYSSAIHFIDVGQGDSVLIEHEGEFALIDAGETTAKETLVAYLQNHNVKTLKYLIMTHPHSDHIGGMQKVLQYFDVQNFVLPDFDKAPMPTTKLFENLIDTATYKQINTFTAEKDDEYALGTGKITILGTGIKSDNLNDISLAIKYDSGNFTFLDTGDAESSCERELTKGGTNLSADIFKAGHHGSSTSNRQFFLKKIRPKVVVISCAQDNEYGHPHNEAITSFNKVNANIYGTDTSGSVIVFEDENGKLSVQTER